MTDDGWALSLVDPDLDLPGWLLVPEGMDDAQRAAWLDQAVADFEGIETWEGTELDGAAVREVLESGLEQRAASDALALLQVWPTLAGQAAVCYIDILPSEAMPDWTDGDAIVHPVSSPHLGPGLHLVTQRTSRQPDGTEVEVASAGFYFDDGEVTVMISLDEIFTPLVTVNLPALVALMQNIGVVHTGTGKTFAAVAPTGLVDTDEWDLEGTA